MFSFNSVTNSAGREILERFMHQHIFELLREEMAKGGSDATIVGNFLKKLRSNAVLEKVREVLGPEAAGLALTGLGAGIAEFLQDQDWTRHIPGNSQVMNEVRVLLQNIVPALIVGTSEAGGDVLDNYDAHVDNVIAKFRSNRDNPVAQPPGLLDKVFVIRPDSLSQMKHPQRYVGKCFTVKLAADGTPEMIGEPDCLYPHLICELGRQFTLEWFQEQAGKTIEEKVTTPGQQNQQQGDRNQQQNNRQTTTMRMVPAKPVPFKGDLVSLEDWARSAQNIDVSQANRILETLERNKPKPATPPKDEQEKVDAQGDIFQTATARSLHLLDELHQKVIIDFLQDVTKAIYINKLGRQFTPDANGQFSKEQMDEIVAYVEMWMGGKLSMWNKTRLFLNHLGGEVRAANSGAARAIRMLAGFGKWSSLAAFVIVLGAVISFVLGAVVMNAPSVANPSLAAVYCVVFGAGVLIISLFFITPIQTAIDVFWPSLKAANPEWLKDKGRIFISFVGLMNSLFMIFLFLGADQLIRLMVGMVAFIAVAVSMGLVAVGHEEEARLRTAKTLRYFPMISVLNLVIMLTISILNLMHVSAADAIKYVGDSKMSLSFLTLIVAGAVVFKFVRWIERKDSARVNPTANSITYNSHGFLRFAGVMLVLLLAAWPWVGKEINNKFGKDNAIHEIKSSISNGLNALKTPVAPQSSVQQPVVPTPVLQAPQATTTSQAVMAAPYKKSTRSAKPSGNRGTKIDCSQVPEDFKESSHCK